MWAARAGEGEAPAAGEPRDRAGVRRPARASGEIASGTLPGGPPGRAPPGYAAPLLRQFGLRFSTNAATPSAAASASMPSVIWRVAIA